MKSFLKQYGILIPLGAVLAVFIAADAYSSGMIPFLKPSLSVSLERYAERVIKTCSKESYPPSCYDKEIPKLMDQGLTMEEVFQITSVLQDKVGNYFYCHVLGHNLSSKETAKDPSKWTEVVARCPTGMCSNGCLHGAAQERFRDDALSAEEVQALVPELATICEPDEEGHRDFTGLEQASCYHSLGHLTMYISGADIRTATDICDQIAKKGDRDYRQTCYEGAYMQIFQPLDPEDFALVDHIPAKTVPEAEEFCDQFTGEALSACHRESWPLYLDQLLSGGDGIEAFCQLTPGPENVKRCYNAIFYVLTARFNFEEEKIVPLCNSLPEKRKAQCFGNAASRSLETDYRLIPNALNICKAATDAGVGSRCYDELLFYSSFNFHKDSDAFNRLCAALPEPYGTKCTNGEGKDIRPSQQDL